MVRSVSYRVVTSKSYDPTNSRSVDLSVYLTTHDSEYASLFIVKTTCFSLTFSFLAFSTRSYSFISSFLVFIKRVYF